MRGKKGFFSLFTNMSEPEEEGGSASAIRRRRRHSSGDRETWGRKVEYVFAGLGYAVGLGNIWRFPYLCYRNGGGAFLIPYILALCVVGFPMLHLEMGFGQFASLGTITIWRICPLFKGIGYTIIAVLLLVNTYYSVLIAYGLFYLFASITSELPWARCDNAWNTEFCITKVKRDYNGTTIQVGRDTHSAVVQNITTAVSHAINSSASSLQVNTTEIPGFQLKTPTEEFFERHVLRMSSGIHELGVVQWPLIVCLCVSWITCFFCLFRGIKSMGKAVIFTTIFSYLILTVLLVRGVTLPGSLQGIIFYLKPDFSKLTRLQVWGEASAQAFASLTLGGGGWITLSSYNKFHNKIGRDVVMVGVGNALTSLYSGFVIFSVLGYMAHIKGVKVDDVTAGGPGLAFVAYPEGLAMIPGAPFWSICFFFMMFTVGLDSLFGQVETIAAGVIDEFPDYLRPRRKIFTLFLCAFMLLMGIPIVTQGGIYIVTLMDWYTLLYSFTIISLFEIIVIIYIYGYNRFAEDIEMMTGSKPNLYYKVTWLAITPVLLLCVIAFLAANYVPAYYGQYYFPKWAESIGWGLALCPCLLIPITMIIQFLRKCRTCSGFTGFFTNRTTRQDILMQLVNPSLDWGPALPDDWRRYSAKRGTGDEDDVFQPAELVAVKSISDEKDRLVHFQDQQKTEAEVSAEAKKYEDADAKEKADKPAASSDVEADDKPSDTEVDKKTESPEERETKA